MNWIDDRREEIKNRQERERLIAEAGAVLFADLWNEIVKWVVDAAQKGIRVTTNGTTWERRIVLSRTPLPHQDSRAADVLTMKTSTVNGEFYIGFAGVPRINTKFNVDLCADNVACLKHNGEQVSMEQVAIIVLDPFLFPELHAD